MMLGVTAVGGRPALEPYEVFCTAVLLYIVFANGAAAI